jgi:cyclopropane fatty-acyl-phospholipid synthase-like methyltransferase
MILFWQITNLIGIVLCFIVLYYVLNGAPYFPSSKNIVSEMVRLANVQAGQHMIDIGSGDGRILIAFTKAGAITEGYEINPLLVWWSRRKIKEAGLSDRCVVHTKNLWKADLSHADIVTVFGIKGIMKRLEKKCRNELPKGTKVISHIFTFPTWKPDHADEQKGLYLYTV